MMRAWLRGGRSAFLAWSRALALLMVSLATLAACHDTRSPFEVPTDPRNPPGPGFPQPDRAGRIFHEPPGLYASAGAVSRIVIYDDDGELVLQLIGPRGLREFPGRYTRDGDLLDVDFGNPPHPWRAMIQLHGRGLTIRYNVSMLLDGFEDGEYGG